ncbi:MAG: bifunctional folylpolyglutamate synthase/dihydrofolate synthase [Anaerolineae bacterium]|nr:bifunctional folylpolyglutamate synthase/dihydrofolate synthase [Anaerolineales bacterium]MCQ3977340.1 bifunctional folylpolyglutamate synthase/dihydrofolate synthase [Anaerolineae bacterium]
MPINSYLDALTYFYSYAHYNPADISNWSLDRLKGLLARLGDPHKKFPSLLIAGTKGKGSTAAMAESILRQAGYKTGLYTSPHLHSFRERIRLGGEAITEEQVVALARSLKPYFEDTPNLTAFELITAAAFVAFAEANIEAAVLEVGLGGRLDATNAVDPAVAVITSISYDHMQILGDTLTLIAREKAGIIRPGALVISAPQYDEAMQMIEQVCADHRARLVLVGRDWQWQPGEFNFEGQSFRVGEQDYWLPLMGEHQLVNAVTAMAAVTGFVERTGLAVAPEAVKTGLANVNWPGRLELLQRNPFLVVDSAMNGDSAEKLIQALQHHFPERPITFIFGASSDHPIRDMLNALLPHAARMFTVASRHPRAAKAEWLADLAAELGYTAVSLPDVATALARTLAETEPDGLICVTGSLFLVADVREAWLHRQGLPLPLIDPVVVS